MYNRHGIYILLAKDREVLISYTCIADVLINCTCIAAKEWRSIEQRASVDLPIDCGSSWKPLLQTVVLEIEFCSEYITQTVDVDVSTERLAMHWEQHRWIGDNHILQYTHSEKCSPQISKEIAKFTEYWGTTFYHGAVILRYNFQTTCSPEHHRCIGIVKEVREKVKVWR